MTERDPFLDAFFDAERGFTEAPPSGARTRVLAALRNKLPDPEGGSDPDAGGGGSPGAGAGTVTKGTALMGMLATFAIGAVTGALLVRRAPPPAPPAAPVPVHTIVIPSTVPPPIDSVIELPDPPTTAKPRPPPSVPSPELDAKGAAAERALLDAARVAIAQGEAERALEVVERHRQEYPRGSLAEEREALAVRALVKVGRHDEARARAARFEAAYPNSIALPAVKAAIGSIP